MMARNDFEILARHLKALYPKIDGTENQSDVDYRDGYNAAISQVIGACSAVNARFDTERFKAACGIAAPVRCDDLPGFVRFPDSLAQETGRTFPIG